jgi:hypothetical protein
MLSPAEKNITLVSGIHRRGRCRKKPFVWSSVGDYKRCVRACQRKYTSSDFWDLLKCHATAMVHIHGINNPE